MRQGYGHAVSELYAQQDEEREARETLAEQSEAAYRKSVPPLAPDREYKVEDSRVLVYLDGNAGEMRRREAEAKKIREGGRR